MMRKTAWRRFDDLFPSRRCILAVERECEYQWGNPAFKVLAGHPNPCERLPSSKGDLTLANAKLRRPEVVYRAAQDFEDLSRNVLSCEKLIQRHLVNPRLDYSIPNALILSCPTICVRDIVPKG